MDFKHHLSQSFREGKEAGLQEGAQIGAQNKAVEDALMLINEYLH